MTASQYRQVARGALRGYWGTAIAVTVVAGLIVFFFSGIISRILSFFLMPSLAEMLEMVPYLDDYYAILAFLSYYFVSLIPVLMLLSLLSAPAQALASGVLNLGKSEFDMDVVTRWKRPSVNTLFSKFNMYGKALALELLIMVFTWLWSLLFVIPGIVASYRYAMARYLLLQNPGMSAMDAIRASKQLMNGHKGRLFALSLSFIGWYLLVPVTCGLIMLYVEPYLSVAFAAFYLDLTGQLDRQQAVFGYQAFNTPPAYYPPPAGGPPPTPGGAAFGPPLGGEAPEDPLEDPN
jgi:uncharacterized membrane protein